jgi:hypothetical protein
MAANREQNSGSSHVQIWNGRIWPIWLGLAFIQFSVSAWLGAQAPPSEKRDAEFRELARRLVAQRLSGGVETEEPQEKALAILDVIVTEHLNQSAAINLAELNERLARLVVRQPPLGERLEVVLLGAPRVGGGTYALVVNFSQSGPSAVRLYAPSSSGYRLSARIDRFRQTDFFDEYLELVPVRASDIVFVTVTGRVDELQTGSFAAWRWRGDRLDLVWSVDVLEHSTYEAKPDGFHLKYCSQFEEDNPRRCRKFTRDLFVWDGIEWRRMAREELDPPK